MKRGSTKRKIISKTKTTAITARIQRQQRLYASIPSQSVSLKYRMDIVNNELLLPIPVVDCQCPYCHYKMDDEQVDHGFLSRIDDFTTKCPQCEKRFETSGTIYLHGKIERFVWLCRKQTQNELITWSNKYDLFIGYLVDKLLEERPELAWNAYRHCFDKQTVLTEAVRMMLK